MVICIIEKDKIADGVINMLRVNMGPQEGEKLLVVTDIPMAEELSRSRYHREELLGF